MMKNRLAVTDMYLMSNYKDLKVQQESINAVLKNWRRKIEPDLRSPSITDIGQ
jgi:hypothetical protein